MSTKFVLLPAMLSELIFGRSEAQVQVVGARFVPETVNTPAHIELELQGIDVPPTEYCEAQFARHEGVGGSRSTVCTGLIGYQN